MIASLIEFIRPMNRNASLAEYHAKNLITCKIKLRHYSYFHLAATGLLINEYEVSKRHGAKVIIKSRTVLSIKFHVMLVAQVHRTRRLPH